MPDLRISELPPAAALDDTDYAPVVQNTASPLKDTRRATIGAIKTAAANVAIAAANAKPVQHFATRAEAITWVASPIATSSIIIHGYTTVGDCPPMRYTKVTNTYLTGLNFSAASKARLAFQAVDGSWWLLDERCVYASQVGAFGNPVGADPTTDCKLSLQAGLDYSGVFPERWLELEWRNYLSLTSLLMPPRSTIRGPLGLGRDPKISSGQTSIEALHYQPGLVLPSTQTLGYSDACQIEDICVRRQGIAAHYTFAAALDFQATGFQGIGISRGSSGDATGCTFRRIRLYGWLVGLDCFKTNGCVVEDIYGDNAVTRVSRDAAETCFYDHEKQKPFLTNNDATAIKTITVSVLYDAAGKLGFVCDEDAVALGMTNGTRIANKKMPAPYDSKRLTVEIDPAFSDGRHLFFTGSTWTAEYASYTLVDRSQISFVPGGSYGLVDPPNHIYRVPTGTYTGKIGVRTRGAMALQVGHWAVFECGGLPQRGFCKILQRVSATEFIIDRDWPTVGSPAETALLALNVWEFELTAQPNSRVIVNPPVWLTTDRGASFILDGGAGGFLTGASKGAGYRLEDAAAMRFSINVEEGSTGEQETSIPGRTGLAIKNGSRLVGYGVFVKSHDTGMSVDLSSKGDNVVIYGGEIVDDGYAAIDQTNGRLVLNDIATRGANPRVRVSDIDHLWIRGGEYLLENISSSSTDPLVRARDYARVHADILSQEKLKALHNTIEWWGFVENTLTGEHVLTQFGELTASGLAMNVPVTAPNITQTRLTGNTVATASVALTTAGTAAVGTVSGFNVPENASSKWATLQIVAHRTNGSGGTMTDVAVWTIPVLMRRGQNASNTFVSRPDNASLLNIPPTIVFGTALAGARVDLSTSGASLVVDADAAGITGGADAAWVCDVLPGGLPAIDRTPIVVPAGNTLTLTRAEHRDRTIVLDGAGATIALDATSLGAGFACRVENATGSDWPIPAVVGAAGRYPRGAAHTHLYAGSSARLELISVGGSMVVSWTGDTYTRPSGLIFAALLTGTPTDPGYTDQWWLKAPAPGIGDMAGQVWPYYQGAGVKVLLLDSGVWYREEASLPAGINGLRDLRDNYDSSLHLVYQGVTYDGTRIIRGNIAADYHGSSAAGVIAGAINGGGAIGVAPRATICCVHTYDPTTAVYIASADTAAQQAASGHAVNFDVVYSKTRADLTNLFFRAGLQDAIDLGRGGLGTIVVHPANNQDDDTGSTGCFPGTITVTALEADGTLVTSSSYASYAFVSAPGPTDGIACAGPGSSGSGEDQWNPGFGLTSAASAVTAGVCTLLLEVAPALGWRDVHEVLALTARMTGSGLASAPTGTEHYPWVTNGATWWNGGGLRHSKDYGFGAVHAESAVRLARSYRDLGVGGNASANAVDFLSASSNPGLSLGGVNTTRTFNIVVAAGDDMVIEQLHPIVYATGVGFASLGLSVTSPAGTTANIAFLAVANPLRITSPSPRMRFHAEAFRGERLAGTWTFTITAPSGNSNTWTVAQLAAMGRAVPTNTHHVITDDLSIMVAASAGRATITAAGNDTLNGAALSSTATMNFLTGAATLDGTTCTLATPGGFGAVYGGAGADSIVCHNSGMLAFGGDGNDVIVGGNGADTICGGPGADTLTGGRGSDVFLYRSIRDSLPSAPDTITDFSPGSDRVRLEISSLGTFIGSAPFSGRPFELRVVRSGGITTAYFDTNGDATADMAIVFSNGPALGAGDFDFADPQ